MKRVITIAIVCLSLVFFIGMSIPAFSLAENFSEVSKDINHNLVLDDTTGGDNPIPPPPSPR